MHLSPHHQQVLLEAARHVIRHKLRGDALPEESPHTPRAAGSASSPSSCLSASAPETALSQPAGCFVTLHARRTHELRGCVGRLDAADPLLEAVRRAAAGVLCDPRFAQHPVRLAELPELQIEVSVLSPLRPAPGPLEFDLLYEGVYLVWGDARAGCFLPQVARETGWSREQLLARLCVEKMGLPPSAWQDPAARLFVFTTLVIGPEPFEGQPRAAPSLR